MAKGKGFFKTVGDKLNKLIENAAASVEKATTEIGRPETEKPIKDVISCIKNVIQKDTTNNNPDFIAARQLKNELERAITVLNQELEGLKEYLNKPQELNTKWNKAVLEFNQTCHDSIAHHHSAITQAPGFWNALKSALNVVIELINDTLKLDETDKIRPFILEESNFSLSNADVKTKMDDLKKTMVESMRPKAF